MSRTPHGSHALPAGGSRIVAAPVGPRDEAVDLAAALGGRRSQSAAPLRNLWICSKRAASFHDERHDHCLAAIRRPCFGLNPH